MPRRNVVLSENSERRLKAIRQAKDAHSDAEVIRDAIRFLDDMIVKQIQGYKIFLTPPGKNAPAETLPELYDPRQLASLEVTPARP